MRGMGKKRNSKNFVAIPFSLQLALSTLGNDVVIKGDTVTFGEDIYIMSVDASWSLTGHTAGELPILVGMAHGDLTVGEIVENLVAEVSDPDDIIAAERARRPVRKAGKFAVGGVTDQQLADGREIRTKVKFTVGNDHALACWAMNLSGATLTTGATVDIDGTIFGRWRR